MNTLRAALARASRTHRVRPMLAKAASAIQRSLRSWRRSGFVIAAIALLVGLASGSAYAYWHAAGSGNGSATTGTASAVTVQAVGSGSPTSSLIPGSSADLLVQLNNPNSYPVTIVAVSQTGSAFTVTGGTGCTSANSGVSVPTVTGLSIAVGTGTQLVHIANGTAMSSASASGCQGASFQIPISVTVQK
jgi:hypothetical protein